MMKPSLWRGICQRKSFQNFFARRKLLLAVVVTATTVTSFVLPIFFAIPFTEWVPRSKLSAERCLVQTPQVQVLPILDNVPWSCNVPHNAASNGRLLWPLSPQLPCCYQPVSMSSSRIVLPADEGRGWRLPVETVDAVENGYELVLTSCEGTKGSSLHFFPTPKIKNAEESRAISVVVLRTSGKDPQSLAATWSLLRKANAVNMEAYTQLHSPHNKSDVLAALTGIPEFDFPLRCLQDSSSTCPWIWRRFSAAGATTLLLEESPCVGDFATRPTDVWLRPLTELMDDALLEFDRGGDCPQATLRPRWLGLYLRTALHAVTRGAGPYWAMVYVTASDVIDAELAAVMGDVLNQAVVFLMSDKTLSVAVPQWFRQAFPDALANLSSNRRRNTTPFDVHETMVHLSDFERVNQRNGSDSADTQHKDVPGLSLFLPVPEWAPKKETPPPPPEEQVQRAASAMASLLNRRLARKDARCSPLSVIRVLSARTEGPDLLLVAETAPDGVVVEALMGLGDQEPGSVSLKNVVPADLDHLCHFNTTN